MRNSGVVCRKRACFMLIACRCISRLGPSSFMLGDLVRNSGVVFRKRACFRLPCSCSSHAARTLNCLMHVV